MEEGQELAVPGPVDDGRPDDGGGAAVGGPGANQLLSPELAAPVGADRGGRGLRGPGTAVLTGAVGAEAGYEDEAAERVSRVQGGQEVRRAPGVDRLELGGGARLHQPGGVDYGLHPLYGGREGVRLGDVAQRLLGLEPLEEGAVAGTAH